jgi:hypothetical protein
MILKNQMVIVGGGFSAFTAKLFIGRKSRIYTAKYARPRRGDYIQHKFFNVKKLFFTGSPSIGFLKSHLKKTFLHSILYPGGNTNIWGGFINIRNLSKSLIDLLYTQNIFLNRLSPNSSGSVSNNSDIFQLIDRNKNVLNVGSRLGAYNDVYFDSFRIERNTLRLFFYNVAGHRVSITTNKLTLCIGFTDLLDLLYRSGFLKNGDKFELSEFKYSVKFRLGFIFSRFRPTSSTILRYDLSRALNHLLGYQRRFFLSFLFKFFPLTVEQIFYKRKITTKLYIHNGSIYETSNNPKNDFGRSIHYFGLRINNMDINSFLNKLHPGLLGLGMAFVDQKFPGPISNDILIDAYKKFKNP